MRRPAGPKQRLVGYQRVDLAPGQKLRVRLVIDPRLLADWSDGRWKIVPGVYTFALGSDAAHLGEPVSVSLGVREWKD